MDPKTLELYANQLRWLTSGGAGNGATVTAVLDTEGSVRSAVINAAGSGYSVDDVLSIDEGDGNATFTVTAVNGTGGVTAITKTASGTGYTGGVNNASTEVAPAGGTGCTLDFIVEKPIASVTVDTGGNSYISVSVQAPGAAGDTPAVLDGSVDAGVLEDVSVILGGAYLDTPDATVYPRGPATPTALLNALKDFDTLGNVQGLRLIDVLEDGMQQVIVPSYAKDNAAEALEEAYALAYGG